MWPKLFEWLKSANRLVLGAPRCLLCHAATPGAHGLCGGCATALPLIRIACPRCGIPLAAGGVCGRCQVAPPPFDSAAAAMEYAGAVRWLVRRFKFHGDLACGAVLGELLAEHLVRSEIVRPELIVPVPLHPRRWRTRGFNQADELARVVGRRLNIPVDNRVVARRVATREQAGLHARQRQRNVRAVFEMQRPLTVRSVVIVDDVMTTGSTVGELARVLRAAGATRIDVWCVARAVLHDSPAIEQPHTASDDGGQWSSWLS